MSNETTRWQMRVGCVAAAHNLTCAQCSSTHTGRCCSNAMLRLQTLAQSSPARVDLCIQASKASRNIAAHLEVCELLVCAWCAIHWHKHLAVLRRLPELEVGSDGFNLQNKQDGGMACGCGIWHRLKHRQLALMVVLAHRRS